MCANLRFQQTIRIRLKNAIIVLIVEKWQFYTLPYSLILIIADQSIFNEADFLSKL